MLQRLLVNFNVRISSRRTNILFGLPISKHSCHQCRHRLYFTHKAVSRNYYERTSRIKNGIFNTKTRYFSSQVDVKDKNEAIESSKVNSTITTSKKINVKLKPTELKRLFDLAAPEKWTLTGAIGLLVISSSVTMAVPFSLGKVLDIIYSSTNDLAGAREKLDTLCLMLCGVFLIGGLCNFGRVYLMTIAGQRMTQSLRKQVYNAILRQEPAWFGKNSTGELVNRLSADTQLVGRNLSQNVSDGLRSLFMVGAGTGMMMYMSPSLAMVGLCVVPPVSVLAVIYGRFVRNITRQLQDSLAETSELAEEKISNIKTVKAFSKEQAECESYSQKIEKVLQLAYKESLAVGSFYGLTGLSGNTIIILVLYYGGGMVATEQLSVGNLTSFLLYAAYVGISIGGLSSFYTELNKGMGAATRLWEIIDRQPTIPTTGGLRPKERPKGEIVLENVSFDYQGAPLLKGLNLHLHPGRSLALVGRSGCGKSTVASLILRLYDPVEGRVLLDGVDIRDLDPVWLRSHIGYVSQVSDPYPCLLLALVGRSGCGKSTVASLILRLYDPVEGRVLLDGVDIRDQDPMWLRSHYGYVSQEPVLFSGSIKDNILYGSLDELENSEELSGPDIKDKAPAWLRAARTAHLHELVRGGGGWARDVGARGGQLSGGQKQRVAIARAIVKDPKILILDEATSALDTFSEYLVDKALKNISKDRTMLTIAHRLSTIQSADEVAVLDGGLIVEKGPYAELIAKPEGVFREIITHQRLSKKPETNVNGKVVNG